MALLASIEMEQRIKIIIEETFSAIFDLQIGVVSKPKDRYMSIFKAYIS